MKNKSSKYAFVISITFLVIIFYGKFFDCMKEIETILSILSFLSVLIYFFVFVFFNVNLVDEKFIFLRKNFLKSYKRPMIKNKILSILLLFFIIILGYRYLLIFYTFEIIMTILIEKTIKEMLKKENE